MNKKYNLRFFCEEFDIPAIDAVPVFAMAICVAASGNMKYLIDRTKKNPYATTTKYKNAKYSREEESEVKNMVRRVAMMGTNW